MLDLICKKCNKIFTRTNDLTRHMNRKIPCDSKNIINKNLTNIFGCKYCNNTYTTKYNLNRHELTCKIKIQTKEIYTKETNAQTIITNNNSNSNNTNNNTINNVSIYYNIPLESVGKENYDKVPVLNLLSMIKNCNNENYLPIAEFYQHTRTNYGQYNNAYVINPNRAESYIYVDEQWSSTMKKELVSEAYHSTVNKLMMICQDLVKYGWINPYELEILNKILNDPVKIKKTKDKIQCLLFDVKDTAKQIRANNNFVTLQEQQKIYGLETYRFEWKPTKDTYSFDDAIKIIVTPNYFMSKIEMDNYFCDDDWFSKFIEQFLFNDKTPEFLGVYYDKEKFPSNMFFYFDDFDDESQNGWYVKNPMEGYKMIYSALMRKFNSKMIKHKNIQLNNDGKYIDLIHRKSQENKLYYCDNLWDFIEKFEMT